MKNTILFIFLILIFISTKPANAYDDFQAWSFVKINGYMQNPYLPESVDSDLLTSLEFNYRLKSDVSEFQNLILKPTLGYDLGDGRIVWIGYAYGKAATDNGYRYEQRFFQMMTYKYSIGRSPVVLVSKTRIEERFYHDLPDVTIRFRQMLEISFKIFKVKDHEIKIFGKAEYLYNFTHADPLKSSGYDQSRFLTGLKYRLNMDGRDLDFSLGYMNNHDNKDMYNHGVNFGISISLGKREKERKVEDPEILY